MLRLLSGGGGSKVRVEVTSIRASAPPPLEGQQNKRPQRSQRLTDGGKGWGEGEQGGEVGGSERKQIKVEVIKAPQSPPGLTV